ncbi:N5-carboxyaminoimidazole ribonucleotide synthase [Stieleria neptunia]|uniref:N5-carboxyaminoimidazole ribonucleotide synthase n=1 Tax=Stieleria neptunia TaxID=2527979 RepID=A0A518HS73_9BACT|nr:5-(carboxyamino)imidazole ribonucleotide synthase [Stieleria neptunia]QDV43648.1 N5-carboxyaminoimidazole ribonucleotide synthase [Stieleria neptunia]
MSALESNESMVMPGATIGMVGGGQLGRMFAIAAMQMGYDVVVFCGSPDEPAGQVATRTVVGDLLDHAVVSQFAQQCQVITLEFENIPAETIRWCSEFAPTYPSHHVLATAQDRLVEKTTFRDAGLAVTPYAAVDSAAGVGEFAEQHGWPVIVKTARSGYDGKGQYRLDGQADAAAVPWESADAWIAEKWISFDREASVVVARSAAGEVRCFPPFENDHRNHILDVSFCPSTLSPAQQQLANSIATRAADVLQLVGVLCVEFFVVDAETILINEVAPRPHNSGHLTIEACHTSQFEQHVRAVCGLPLGSTELRVGGAAMANLLGDLWSVDGQHPSWDQALAVPSVSLHLYGKTDAKVGRKMGHLTATAGSASEAVQAVNQARESLI